MTMLSRMHILGLSNKVPDNKFYWYYSWSGRITLQHVKPKQLTNLLIIIEQLDAPKVHQFISFCKFKMTSIKTQLCRFWTSLLLPTGFLFNVSKFSSRLWRTWLQKVLIDLRINYNEQNFFKRSRYYCDLKNLSGNSFTSN